MGKKVLILSVDSDPTSQEQIKLLLNKKDWVVITVPDAKTVLEVAEAVVLDLVLIKVEWSQTDGFELAKRIKKHCHSYGRNVPIIAVTNGPVEEGRQYFLSQWIDNFISKPVNSNILYPTIHKYLHSRQVTSSDKGWRISKIKEISF